MLSKDDIGRITDLLTIVEKISTVAPGFMSISGEAMAELRSIDTDLRTKKLEETAIAPNDTPGQPTNNEPVPSQPVGQGEPVGNAPFANRRLGDTPLPTSADDNGELDV